MGPNGSRLRLCGRHADLGSCQESVLVSQRSSHHGSIRLLRRVERSYQTIPVKSPEKCQDYTLHADHKDHMMTLMRSILTNLRVVPTCRAQSHCPFRSLRIDRCAASSGFSGEATELPPPPRPWRGRRGRRFLRGARRRSASGCRPSGSRTTSAGLGGR